MEASSPQSGGDDYHTDLLIGAEAILAFLLYLGWPEDTTVDDVYYLKRSRQGWPIGNTAGDSGKLISSKRKLIRHTEKLTRGSTAA